MNKLDIIAHSLKAEGKNPDEVLPKIIKAVENKKAYAIQFKNSVLLILGIEGHDVEFHFYSADAPMAVIQALKFFKKMLQHLPFQRAYTPSATPQILRALQIAGITVQRSDRKGFRWMADLKE